jgi:hypothetical protein
MIYHLGWAEASMDGCEKGKRLIAHVPLGHWKTTTLIATRISGREARFATEN